MRMPATLFACGLALAAWTLNASSNAGLPEGWSLGGEAPRLYAADIDSAGSPSGKGALVLRRTETSHPYGSAWLARSMPVGPYAGKRVRLSMRVRFEDTEPMEGKIYIGTDGGAHLQGGRFGAGWNVYQATLGLPADLKHLKIGVGLKGPGRVSVDDIELQVLGEVRTGQNGTSLESDHLQAGAAGKDAQ
jgi:hypothetical protein